MGSEARKSLEWVGLGGEAREALEWVGLGHGMMRVATAGRVNTEVYFE